MISSIMNIEVRHRQKIERLRNIHRMSHYRFNTLRWKIKNDLDIWERKEIYKLEEILNKKNERWK